MKLVVVMSDSQAEMLKNTWAQYLGSASSNLRVVAIDCKGVLFLKEDER